MLQLIMETDVEGLIGAGRHERSGERTTWRNGYPRSRPWRSQRQFRRLSRRSGSVSSAAPTRTGNWSPMTRPARRPLWISVPGSRSPQPG
ncbi:hypothetical protein [Gemmobacter denitrificans]|uniref:hypothetical protein n=1 Tax=Gemmobacter denitrificans TaxID=3123040 RepID=UPI003D9C7793